MNLLTVSEVLELHVEAIKRFGGDPTIPPEAAGRVESALYSATYYEGELAYAAALLFYLARAQHFTDGNKRTAYASCLRAMELNGYTLEVTVEAALTCVMTMVNEKHVTINEVADMMAEWVKELE